jgi:UDP-N-acetylglucosamine acyltransferase
LVHPTAILHPGAIVGEGTQIGPYCVIGEGVEIGARCHLQHHVTVCGPTKIGDNNRFYAFGSIGQQTQDLKYAGEPTYLEIGNGNTFREFVTIHRGTAPGSKTIVGNGGNFLSYSHIAHDCVVGDHVIFSNNGTLGGHVEVGDHAIIGGLTAIHQFCRIGKFAMTGGCSKIVQDVPPFMIADGNPALVRGINQVGMERNGFSPESIREVREAYRLIYRSAYNVKQAAEQIQATLAQTPEVAHLLEFIINSPRGIIRRQVRKQGAE